MMRLIAITVLALAVAGAAYGAVRLARRRGTAAPGATAPPPSSAEPVPGEPVPGESVPGESAPGESVPDHRRRRISLLTEAVSYVGAILILAGGIAAIGQRWPDISGWGRVAVFAGFAAFFLAIGLVVRSVTEPAAQRLIGVTWFLSVGAVASAIGFAAHQVYGRSGQVSTLLLGAGAAVYAAALWLARRRAAQQAALFAALVVTIAGVIVTTVTGPATTLAFGLGLWGFGLAWAALGWRGYAAPGWTALVLGIVLALLAPSISVTEYGWVYAIGVATAAAAMAVSVPAHNTLLLAAGTLTTFGYVTSLVVRYFGESLGVPTALVITGVLVLALAAVGTRLLRMARPPGRGRDAGPGLPRPEDRPTDAPGGDQNLPMAS